MAYLERLMVVMAKAIGFSVDASVRIHKGDREGLRRLVRYMARPAVSVERVSYNGSTGKVIVRSCKKVNGQRAVKAAVRCADVFGLVGAPSAAARRAHGSLLRPLFNAHTYDGYDDSHDHRHYDSDAAWSPDDWDQA